MENKNWIELSKIIGKTLEVKVRKILGGEIIYIPKKDSVRISKKIMMLYKQKKSPTQIYKQLGCGKRYVFLIIERMKGGDKNVQDKKGNRRKVLLHASSEERRSNSDKRDVRIPGSLQEGDKSSEESSSKS